MVPRLGLIVALAAVLAEGCGAWGSVPFAEPGPGVRADLVAVVHVFPGDSAAVTPAQGVQVAIFFEVSDPGPAPIRVLTIVPSDSWWDRHEVVAPHECSAASASPDGRRARSVACGPVEPGRPVTVVVNAVTREAGTFDYSATVWDGEDAANPVPVRRADGSRFRLSWEEVIPPPAA